MAIVRRSISQPSHEPLPLPNPNPNPNHNSNTNPNRADLDGDGYIMRVSLHDGKATFKSRFVQTDEYKEEETANKVLFRSTFRTQKKNLSQYFGGMICPNNAFDLKLKNLANTNVAYWSDRLVALFEAGVPYRLCPHTLDTLGTDEMEVNLKPGMSVLVEELRDFNSELHDSIFGVNIALFCLLRCYTCKLLCRAVLWVMEHVLLSRTFQN